MSKSLQHPPYKEEVLFRHDYDLPHITAALRDRKRTEAALLRCHLHTGTRDQYHNVSAAPQLPLNPQPCSFPHPEPPHTMGNTTSAPKISAQDRAILDLKNQRDSLRKYQKRITLLTSRETSIARQCLASGDKRTALLALRRKKYQESLLRNTDGQLEQLEKLTSSVEFALVQKDVLFGLQRGTEVLREINREMGGLEGVERMMGESEEARRVQEEISEGLAGRLSNGEEDDVEDELERMEREMGGGVVEMLPGVPEGRVVGEESFPEIPEGEVDVVRKQKERARARERVALEAS